MSQRTDMNAPGQTQVTAGELRFAFIASQFNGQLVQQMMDGAADALHQNGVQDDQIDHFQVPGAFELPLVAQQLAEGQSYDAIIAFGIVIRGETPHFDFISSACAHGLTNAALETGIPVLFGVLTTDTYEQAVERADSQRKNKGGEVGLAALEMARLMQSLPASL